MTLQVSYKLLSNAGSWRLSQPNTRHSEAGMKDSPSTLDYSPHQTEFRFLSIRIIRQELKDAEDP